MFPCPSPETLARIAHDSSRDARFALMDAHVEACSACQDVLARLVADSSAWEVRESKRLPPPEQPPTIPGFVIERELGRGGMGVVYQTWQPQFTRCVALKVVCGGVVIGAEDREQWLREARAMGGVRHRNIVPFHDAGEQDGCLYLVLDLIPGGSLAERVCGPLPTRVAAGLMVSVAHAVEHLHRAGLVHLDIKPSNILLDGPPDGTWDQVIPMVTDFGIARTGDDPGATAAGPIGLRGTPSYMAPEQIAGDRAAIGPRSDVYSLGATLYHLLTGRPPFQAASVIETLDLVRTREPAPPRTLVPGLPRDLETIALTCLRKDPLRRYASAGALADDLQRWLDGFPIRARPVSMLEHAGRWCRRRPAFATLLAILALTLTSSFLGLFTLWRHSENALARAIESDKATSVAVRDLVGLLATTVDASQKLASERLEKSSRVVLDLTAKLRRDRGVAASNLVAICDLECRLSEGLRLWGKYSESRALLIDSLDLLEQRRKDADDPDADRVHTQTFIEFVWLALNQDHLDEAMVYLLRAEETLEGSVHDPRHSDLIVSIDFARREIASLLGRRGLQERGREHLETHVRKLEHMSETFGGDPTIGLLAALGRAELVPDDSTIASLRAAIRKLSTNGRLSRLLGERVAVWIANDIDPYPSSPAIAGEAMNQLDPDAHAVAVIRALESRCEALGVHPALLPVAALRVAIIAAVRGTAQRKAGRLDVARRTAACLSVFAETLARRDPGEAAFHLLLCYAFEQESKNAWKVNDYTVIEETLRQAVGEARTALSLDPRSDVARLKVSGLQDKLIGFASDPRSSR